MPILQKEVNLSHQRGHALWQAAEQPLCVKREHNRGVYGRIPTARGKLQQNIVLPFREEHGSLQTRETLRGFGDTHSNRKMTVFYRSPLRNHATRLIVGYHLQIGEDGRLDRFAQHAPGSEVPRCGRCAQYTRQPADAKLLPLPDYVPT